MKQTYTEINEEGSQTNYGFDPSAIINIISEYPQIGLALVQLPISVANALVHKHNDLKWSDNPTRPGYYWVKNHGGVVSIKEYSSKDIETIVNSGLNGLVKNLFEFAGPLQPPE
jgi:hypothetical protein